MESKAFVTMIEKKLGAALVRQTARICFHNFLLHLTSFSNVALYIVARAIECFGIDVLQILWTCFKPN